MASKYGKETAINSVKNYINTGKSSFITRDYNLRQRVLNYSLADKINNILQNNVLSFENYISLIEQKNNFDVNKEQILNSALMSTYNKYEALSGQGKSYMTSALSQLLLYNSYLGFTKTNGARGSMINGVSVNDVKKMLMTKYGYEDINADVLLQIVTRYVDDILNIQKKY